MSEIQYKAKQLRYKKAALQMLQRDSIEDELYEIMASCEDVRWFMESDDGSLLNAMDSDEEDEYEFRMAFSGLSGKCEALNEIIRDNMITKHFDDFMVGLLGNRYKCIGYDSYEEDYYSLTSFEGGLAERESTKRLMRLTKEKLLAICGQCLGVTLSILDIRHSYDYLKSAFDVLKEQNTSVLQCIKDIEAAYIDWLRIYQRRYGLIDERLITGQLCTDNKKAWVVYDSDFYVSVVQGGVALVSDRYFEVDPATAEPVAVEVNYIQQRADDDKLPFCPNCETQLGGYDPLGAC